MHDVTRERRPIIHSNTPRAARTLMSEIAKLRTDIHLIGSAIGNLEIQIAMLTQELHASNRARLPRYLPADSE